MISLGASLLGISEFASILSLAGQFISIGLAMMIGRLFLKTRTAIWFAAILGALGAMTAHILVDGQGAFLLLLFAPIIYFAAVVGRNGLR